MWETPPDAAGEPHPGPRRRFEQDEIGLFAADPFTRPDRLVAETAAKELE